VLSKEGRGKKKAGLGERGEKKGRYFFAGGTREGGKGFSPGKRTLLLGGKEGNKSILFSLIKGKERGERKREGCLSYKRRGGGRMGTVLLLYSMKGGGEKRGGGLALIPGILGGGGGS